MSIILHPFGPADFDRLISWIADEKSLLQFAGPILKYPLTREQLQHYLEDPDRQAFAVAEGETGKIIGHSEIYHAGTALPRLCRLFIGEKSYRGRGYGKALVEKLLEICFSNEHTRAVELNVYSWNLPAIKCYEKVGFRFNPSGEKVFRVGEEEWLSQNMVIWRRDVLEM